MKIGILGALGALLAEASKLKQKATTKQEFAKVAELFYKLGRKFYELRKWDEALGCYSNSLEAWEFYPPALGEMLELLDRQHKFEQAESLILAAERSKGDLLQYHRPSYYQKCMLLHRLNRTGEAESHLLRMIDHHESEYMPQYLLAQVLDQQGNYDEAFRWAERAGLNQAAKSNYSEESSHFGLALRRKTEYYRGLSESPFRISDDGGPSPNFLVGYSRSGTTLAQHMLETHSKIVTISEQGNLNFCERFVYNSASLVSLSGQELKESVEQYWSNAAQHIEQKTGLTVLDKMPLNITYLDAILHIFPRAKVIVMLRDPRDVIVSNFFQNFRLNRMMHAHCYLEKTVNQYAEVMAFYLECRRFFPDQVLQLRYEDLIREPQPELEKTLSFLGLHWESNILNYRKEAGERSVETPSYRQIVKPLYSTSVGRWHNYEYQLIEHQPQLEFLVRTLGYQL